MYGTPNTTTSNNRMASIHVDYVADISQALKALLSGLTPSAMEPPEIVGSAFDAIQAVL